MVKVAAGICLLCVSSATAQNLIVNGDFATGDLTGWTTAVNASTTVTYDGTAGNPSGSALLTRNNTAASANGNYIYQVIPVTSGNQYKLDADWKGDLLNGGNGRNWAEVFVSFASSSLAIPADIEYKKATDGGPNEVPMPWNWESVLRSHDGGPEDGIYTATDNYMVVGFNLGGRAGVGPGFYNLDNVRVTPWPPIIEPVFTNIVHAGGDIILQGSDGVSQGAYQLLRSPELTQPLASWPSIGIASFDVNGDFSFTNALSGDAANFYRLEVLSIEPVFPVEITAQPQGFATSVGHTADFGVTANGTAPMTYRWYFNTNTLLQSGQGDTLTMPNVQLTDSGIISVTVSNLLGAIPSDFATLTVTNSTQPPSITDQPDDRSVSIGQSADFSVTADGATPLHYQWYYNTNTVLTDQTNSTLTLLNVNTNQAGDYSVSITNLFGGTSSTSATLSVTEEPQELLAFPTAEGYGKYATGGRGGAVYEVTNLSSTGPGSLGAALEASGSRTVVFRVGGTIEGNFTVSNGDITVAGQTAPGDGIAIHGRLTVDANNVIIRYIRVRGLGSGDIITNNHNSPKHTQIYDHISTCWSSDEVMSVYFNENITIQYCMITEANSSSHQFGGIWGGNHNSMHHNLFAHNTSRNPRLASGSGYNDFRNNVIFNTTQPIHGGEKHEVGNDPIHVFQSCNVVANYIKPGPVNPGLNICRPGSRDGSNDAGDWYVAGNVLHGNPEVTANNWTGVSGTYNRLGSPSEHMPIRQQTAEQAYQTVLVEVGCSKPRRDSLDERIINEVRTGTVLNGNGLITSPGPLPILQGGTAPVDADHDGMPDSWESANGLDPNDATDRNAVAADGYTMLEIYLSNID